MDGTVPPGAGIGARVHRKEDARHLAGHGQFVGDIRIAGMQDVAFLRSPVAHARILARRKPADAADRVFFLADLAGVKPMVTRSAIPGYKLSEWPAMAAERVRYVGEIIAMCVAASRAEAEDLAERVEVDFDERPAITSCAAGRAEGAALLHEHWGDNLFLQTSFDTGLAPVAASAPVKVELDLSCARQAMHPMEGKGVVAWWDHRAAQLVVHSSTQVPHLIRAGLAEFLGIPQAMVRVAPPDVGGGFGYK
ncbi:MAG: xanthine dehydrogenase family protein molybdopterin-binding subunit, partial [Acetobacteraceae bacterium]